MLTALLAAIGMLFPPPDLSNHWRWSSASVANSESVTPIPAPNPLPIPTPPNPTPVPTPTPSPYKVGDKCPNCDKGWLTTDSVVKEKCWKCKGDGIINDGDPILSGGTEEESKNKEAQRQSEKKETPLEEDDASGKEAGEVTDSKATGIGEGESKKQTTPETGPAATQTPDASPNIKVDNPEPKAIWYKPQYSPDGFWLWDIEGKRWVRSSKPIVPKQATGHWETQTFRYKVCNGRGCSWHTGSKSVWVADAPAKQSPNKILKPKAAYPIRNSWWTGCSSWRHLTQGQHAGKFDPNYLQSLNWEELQSLHSDAHEGKVKWSYVR